MLVQIEYQEPVHQTGNEFSLRRADGGRAALQSGAGRAERRLPARWRRLGREPNPIRCRTATASRPRCSTPRLNAPVNPTSITVRLQAGFPLGEVKSHHHAIKTESPDASTRIIKLAEGAVPADRDFELTWKPAAEKAPSVGLFREHVGDGDYLLAFVTPPSVEQAEQKPLPREVIFVIDNSGSMGGTSIVQAKASLIYALGRLQPRRPLQRHPLRRHHGRAVPGIGAGRPRASRPGHVVRRRAAGPRRHRDGAGDARGADRHSGGDTNYVRQVVFLTDGAIGNEQQLFETISALRGRSRVFMVGIGSAPNTFLMTRAAELGRGAFTHIGSVDQVEERMRGLFAKLENPAVTGLTAKFSDAEADMTPAVIPDLYRGEPLVLAAQTRQARGLGRDQGPHRRPAVGRDAAARQCRRRQGPVQAVGAAQDRGRRGRAHHAAGQPEDADKTILALALEHQLVTRLTSLVAVDKTPSRPEGEPLKVAELPLNLPAGWDFEKVFGERPQLPAPPAERRADAGEARVQVAAMKRPRPAVAPAPNTVTLPKTATDAELEMIAGRDLADARPDPVRVQSASDVLR